MRRLMITLAVVGALVLGACNKATSSPPGNATSRLSAASTSTSTLRTGGTVTLAQNAFEPSSITFSAGQALRLIDPAGTGGTHRLCLGAAGRCDPSAQGPEALLSPGLLIKPGDTKDIAFPHAGQYQVTCTISPGMHLSISVLATG
jgi:plastocyanin